jgi:hypothetical protein
MREGAERTLETPELLKRTGFASPVFRPLFSGGLGGVNPRTSTVRARVARRARRTAAKPAAQALAGILDSRTLLPAAEVLMRWADSERI